MKRKNSLENCPEATKLRISEDHHSKIVAEHYNSRPEVGIEKRETSQIIQLRKFNNWIKAVLIQQFTRRQYVVLDFGCGKGGDIIKWSKANIKKLVGIDIAQVSIEQAQERYINFRGRKFDAEFHCLDAFAVPLEKVLKKDEKFDLVSSQFVLQYCFESEDKVRMMFQNITRNLRDDGVIIGTIPDSQWIKKKLLQSEGLSFGNSIYSIRFETKSSFPLFGHKYWFRLEDAIDDCPEYLVHFPTFEKIAKEYGLKLILYNNFHDFSSESRKNPSFEYLLRGMCRVPGKNNNTKNIHEDKGKGPRILSEDEWEIAGMYLVFAFQKEKTERKGQGSETKKSCQTKCE